MLKIKTESGKVITLTYDHPIYISKDDNLKIIFEVNAENVEVNDYIAIPKPSSDYSNYRKELKTIPNSDICFDKVVDVSKVKYNGYIYDLTVENNHTYIAGSSGGFAVSNCSGTLHANSAEEAILRLTSPPMNVPKIMLTALNFIIHQQRIRRAGKTVRRILEIVEIVKGGGEGHEIAKTKLYEYNGLKDTLERKGICMWEEEVCEIAGISREELLRDRENRKKVLKYLYYNKIRQLDEVAEYIMKYQIDPDSLLRSL